MNRFWKSALWLAFSCLLVCSSSRAQTVLPEEVPLPAGARVLGSNQFRNDGYGYTHAATLTPDGRFLIQYVNSQYLRIMDARTGAMVKRVDVKLVGLVWYLSFIDDGEHLLIRGLNTAVCVELKSGKTVFQWNSEHPDAITRPIMFSDVSASANLSRYAYGTYNNDQTEIPSYAHVWNARSDSWIVDFPVLQHARISTRLSPDGETLATHGYRRRDGPKCDTNTVQLWDIATKKERARLVCKGEQVSSVVFAPDGKHLLTSTSDGPIEEWDTTTAKQTREFACPPNVGAKLFMAPDGSRFAGTSHDGAIQIWNLATGKPIVSQSMWVSRYLLSVAFPVGQPAVALGMRHDTWQLMELPGKLRVPQVGHYSPIVKLQFSADGKELFSGEKESRLIRWNLADGTQKEVYGTHPSSDRCWPQAWSLADARFSANGRTMFTVGPTGALTEVDLQTGKIVRQLLGGKVAGYILENVGPRISLSADGSRIVATTYQLEDGKDCYCTTVWQLPGGKPIFSVKLQVKFAGSNPTIDAKLDPSGEYLLVCIRNFVGNPTRTIHELDTYSVATGQRIATGVLPSVWMFSFAEFGKSHRTLLVPSEEWGKFLAWDFLAGKRLETKNYLRSSSGTPILLDSRRRLLISIADKPVKPQSKESQSYVVVSEAASGRARFEFLTGRTQCSAYAFSPDGNTLAAEWPDTTIRLFDLSGKAEPQPWADQPTSAEKLWAELEQPNAARAWVAMRELIAKPEVAVPLLKARVAVVPVPKELPPKELAKLLTKLGAPAFAEREAAMRTLRSLGGTIEPTLRATMNSTDSIEVKDRIERLLEFCVEPSPLPIAEFRAIEVLERVGTPAAQEVLQAISLGSPIHPQTIEAADALARRR